jgi:hypothetical protein
VSSRRGLGLSGPMQGSHGRVAKHFDYRVLEVH